MSHDIATENRDRLRALAREAIRCTLKSVGTPKETAEWTARAQEAIREFHTAADPLTVLDILGLLDTLASRKP